MNLCVFAGSSPGARDVYRSGAAALGTAIAGRGFGLVYGGASVGLMGTVADAALAEGGQVIGVIPHSIVRMEVAHEGLSELIVVDSMHERKARMFELSEGFIVLPGGLGSMEEMFEVLTWSQLGIHAKSVGLLNVDGFYDGLNVFLDHLMEESFVKPAHRDLLISDDDPGRLIDRVLDADIPTLRKHIDG